MNFVISEMGTMLIYSEMKCFCWQKGKVLIFNMIVAFQRRGVEGSKKGGRREVLSDTYCIGKQVVVYNGAIVMIFCGLRECRRWVAEG